MTTIESLQSGDVETTLERLKDEVRNHPQVPKYRVFLFQLFAIIGDWDRALSQLKVAADLDEDCQAMADAYQHLLQCEALRHEVFAGRRQPLIFGEPEEWMAQMVEALQRTAAGNVDAAQQLRSAAFESAVATPGELELRNPHDQGSEQRDFAWLADADSRLGPLLEAVVQGKYYWIPFSRIARIELHRPTDLRDFVWIPAEFTWSNGGTMVGMIPTRYPGSERDPDGLVQLARKTVWDAVGADTYHGRGQRMFATDEDEYSLLDISQIRFHGQP